MNTSADQLIAAGKDVIQSVKDVKQSVKADKHSALLRGDEYIS
jgi:hypothetical protein